jgi:hypothetical protein
LFIKFVIIVALKLAVLFAVIASFEVDVVQVWRCATTG